VLLYNRELTTASATRNGREIIKRKDEVATAEQQFKAIAHPQFREQEKIWRECLNRE
jgi:hypothetical protein